LLHFSLGTILFPEIRDCKDSICAFQSGTKRAFVVQVGLKD